MGQVFAPTMVLDGWADLARTFPFEEIRPGALGPVLVRKEPVGVSAGIIPWNVPLFIVALKLGAALAAGSPMILKPSPETPLDGYILGEILDEIELPKGMVSILPAGREVGEYLVRHPGVDKVGFTGSTAAGRKVGAICGELLKRCTLELGGKSAAIVLDDADLAAAIPMLLPDRAHEQRRRPASPRPASSPRGPATTRWSTRWPRPCRGQTVGDPADPTVAIGPLVAERQRERVLGYIDKGKAEGAKLVVGGGRPADLDKGWFVEPTLFADVDNKMTIAQEEIFGPVLSVHRPTTTDAEAVAHRQRQRLRPVGLGVDAATSRPASTSPARSAPAPTASTSSARSTCATRSAASRRRASAASWAPRACRPTSRRRRSCCPATTRRRPDRRLLLNWRPSVPWRSPGDASFAFGSV